jgi:F-type H+-transporting ATPase subunit b
MTPVFANSLINADPGLFIWTAVVFGLFILLLARYAWKPLLASLQQREHSIKESLEAAEKAMIRAEQIGKANEEALREAEQMAQKMRREAMDEAERIRADRMEKAKQEVDELLTKARQTIEQEKKRAMVELRNEVAELAIQSASMILDNELDADKNKKLVDLYIANLSKN